MLPDDDLLRADACATVGTFLVDGMWQGTWRVTGTSLHIEPFTGLRTSDRDALLAEATRMSAFLAPLGHHEPIPLIP